MGIIGVNLVDDLASLPAYYEMTNQNGLSCQS